MTEKRQTAIEVIEQMRPKLIIAIKAFEDAVAESVKASFTATSVCEEAEFHEKRDEAYEVLLVAISNFEDEISQRATMCGETRGYDSAICDLQELSKARRRLG